MDPRTRPENSAICLYSGKVMHARLKPVLHRFTYRVFNMLIDVDRLQEASAASTIFSVNRWNLLSFQERDHGERDGSSLRVYADRMLAKVNLKPAQKVLLLSYPRVLGYTFNPLSVYYCYGDDGTLCALIYQVHNTFGERHSYIEPISVSPTDGAPLRQETDKCFYVSPFLDMEMRYKFRMSDPGQNVRQRILETDAEGPILSATFSGERRPATTGQFLTALLQTMGLTWKITAGIHYEALKLWLKGLKLRTRPLPPPGESVPEAYRVQPGE